MKLFFVSIILPLTLNVIHGQKLMDRTRSTVGYIENGRVMDRSRSTIGYFDADRIMNSSRTTIGYFSSGRVMNSSRSTIGYLENGRVMNSARSTIGYWETGRVLNSNRSTLGYFEGVSNEQAVLFFFFFFYPSNIIKVPTLTTSTIKVLGSTTAESGGIISADGGSSVTARGIVWSTYPTPLVTLSTKTMDGSGIGSFNSTLTSLTPNTTYYARAYATNSAGTGYGNEISFIAGDLGNQRLLDVSRSILGYIENGRVLDRNRSTLGFLEDDKILNVSRTIIGYFENGKVLNSSRSIIGYLEGGKVLNESRTIIGYWENGSILKNSRSVLGYYEGGKGENAALFFFFFFYGSSTIQIPVLTTTGITSLSTTTAISGGTVLSDGGSTVTSRGLVWSTLPGPVISLPTKTSSGSGTGNFTSYITALSPGTTYYAVAYATNSAGTAYGNEISFKTLASPNLSVTPAALTFNSSGANLSLSIKSNISWSITEDISFLSVSPNSGSGDTMVTIRCLSNPSTASRRGSIIINGYGLPVQTISVNQDGNQPIIQSATLTIDVSKPGKEPKDLMGVNIGPGSSIKGYQEAGIREIRTHDYYGPFDYWQYTVNALDTTNKRFKTTFDPTKESSYQWKETDAKMDTIVRNGFKPFFRLGISYPHHSGVPTYPPLDASGQGFQTFGEICRRTVLHYSKGWNNGFNYPISYWEIWNEPDFKEKFWSGPQGTPINYFQLYKSVSTAIKELDGQLKVGGPGLAYSSLFFKNQTYVSGFMSFCQDNRLPLDFYSWHLYDIRNPQGIKAYADTVRTYLDKYGFKGTESFITEINPDLKGSSFQNDARGAAWVTGALISCNQAPVDKFFWYRGVQLSPLADPDIFQTGNLRWPGLGYKLYASFLRENRKTLPVGGEIVISNSFDRDTTSLQALAGLSVSVDTISVLISHLLSPAPLLSVELSNIPWNGSAKIIITRLLDPERKMFISETNGISVNGKLSFSISDALTPGACLLRIIRKPTSTGVSKILPFEAFETFPNPTADDLNILPLGDISGKVAIQLIGMNNQRIRSLNFHNLLAGELIRLPLSQVIPGMYFLQIQTINGIWVKKIEIIR